jgi:hypothetical protein
MATQGQTITSSQPQYRRMIEIFVVAIAGAALAITLAWAAFGATSPKAVTLSRTTNQTLTEPGLVDQRAGEHGVVAPQILEPGLVDQRAGERGGVVAPAPSTQLPRWMDFETSVRSMGPRAGERGGVVAPAPSTSYPGGWTSNYSPIEMAPGGIDRNDHALRQFPRGERGR